MAKRVYVDNSVIGGIHDEEFSTYSDALIREFRIGLYVPVLSAQGSCCMKKTFDAVKFQRARRAELSRKLAKMTPEEAIEYFRKATKPIAPRRTKSTRVR